MKLNVYKGHLELHAPLWSYVNDQGRSRSPLISQMLMTLNPI